MVKINKMISKYNHSSRGRAKIRYIVIHYVGAVSTAKNNARYFAGGNRRASAHLFVDDNEIWQSVEFSRAAWHCGGGLQGSRGHSMYGKCTNSNSIGVELCCKKVNGKLVITEATLKKTAKVVQYLMQRFEVPGVHVIRHYDVTGKNCPGPYCNSDAKDKLWRSTIKPRLAGEGEYTLPNESYTLRRGSRGERVKRLQRNLKRLGYFKYPIATGYYGIITERAVKQFQARHGLKTDGIYGKYTQAEMAKAIKGK